MKIAVVLGWLTVALLPLVAGAAETCGCVKRDPHGVAGASVVFAGKVTQVSDQNGTRRIHFRVLTPYWGPVDDDVELSEPSGGSCRAQFEPGVTYLVYGYAPSASARSGYTTDRCAPNVPVAQAGEQLRELGRYVFEARKNPMEYHFGSRR